MIQLPVWTGVKIVTLLSPLISANWHFPQSLLARLGNIQLASMPADHVNLINEKVLDTSIED